MGPEVLRPGIATGLPLDEQYVGIHRVVWMLWPLVYIVALTFSAYHLLCEPHRCTVTELLAVEALPALSYATT